ncbi:DMT family transporter [Paenibacillus radicis (ex Gao et al. 2016)]|uniref:Membrane protein n=1 Tax=Paenibacillus radicis (ex Gao et al. 2016) TaxID=1737354 RepID=A0A917M473_9BACL|nr:EamA family transporter [Paenibacillus radicis (ex Gao et al. 2016)]GGG76229.1 membrane protein [Paenibacillus radicis (ex Gao et al. 2016)]
MKVKSLLFLLGISLIWGSQFFFVDKVIASVQPLSLAAIKAIAGAVTLALIYSLMSKKTQGQHTARPKTKAGLLFLAIALFEAVIPFFLIGWGQQRVSSSVASIIMGTIPIFTLLILFILRISRLRMMHYLSIGVGFAGILIMILPSLTIDFGNQSLWGMAALVGASLSFALSLVLLEKLPPMSSVLAMRNVLLLASIILIPLSFIIESPLNIRLTLVELVSLLILGVFHAGLVYMMYNQLIKQSGAAFAALTNYIVPVIGVILGTVLLGDQISQSTWFALIIIMISLLLGSMASRNR